MKRLEELGISPAPWGIYQTKKEVAVTTSAEGFGDLESALCRGPRRKSNARLIAAAPKLYDLAYRVLSECDRIMDYDGGTAVVRTCSADRLECAMIELRAALAEAAREEVRDAT